MESEAKHKVIAKKVSASEVRRWSWSIGDYEDAYVARLVFKCPACRSIEVRHPEGQAPIPKSFILPCSQCSRLIEVNTE